MSALDSVLANLNAEIADVKRRTHAGLTEAGRVIERGARDMVPIHKGKLRASSYTRPSNSNPDAVEVGFDEPYAIVIHGDDDMKLEGEPRKDGDGVYWGPDGTSEFLTKAIERYGDEAVAALNKHASR